MNETLSRRDRLIPWYFVAFFTVIALVNGVMVTLAVRTHPGTTTTHAYEEGLHYNDTIAKADAVAALGYRASIEYTNGMLVFSLRDAQGKPVAVRNARVLIRRPTEKNYDQEIQFMPQEHAYVAPVALPLSGQWQVRVFADTPGGAYQHSVRLRIP